MKSADIKAFAIQALEDMKAQDVVTLDIHKLTTIADHMVVATGTSTRHVKSIADELVKRCKEAGIGVRAEGEAQAEWILLDLNDVIVHVMQASIRKLYDLESLWNVSPAKK